MNLCSAPDCVKPSLKRGLCNAHYLRAWRHGSPSAGGTAKGAAQEFLSRALEYHGDDCLRWPFAAVKGYGQIRVDGRAVLVSRLVCEAQNGPPLSPELEAAHSCGNGHLGCVTRAHLRWATRAENRDDMVLHGRSNKGKSVRQNRMTPKQRQSITELSASKSKFAIARQLGVTPSAIAYHLNKEPSS